MLYAICYVLHITLYNVRYIIRGGLHAAPYVYLIYHHVIRCSVTLYIYYGVVLLYIPPCYTRCSIYIIRGGMHAAPARRRPGGAGAGCGGAPPSDYCTLCVVYYCCYYY